MINDLGTPDWHCLLVHTEKSRSRHQRTCEGFSLHAECNTHTIKVYIWSSKSQTCNFQGSFCLCPFPRVTTSASRTCNELRQKCLCNDSFTRWVRLKLVFQGFRREMCNSCKCELLGVFSSTLRQRGTVHSFEVKTLSYGRPPYLVFCCACFSVCLPFMAPGEIKENPSLRAWLSFFCSRLYCVFKCLLVKKKKGFRELGPWEKTEVVDQLEWKVNPLHFKFIKSAWCDILITEKDKPKAICK